MKTGYIKSHEHLVAKTDIVIPRAGQSQIQYNENMNDYDVDKIFQEELNGSDPMSILLAGQEVLDGMNELTHDDYALAWEILDNASMGAGYNSISNLSQKIDEVFSQSNADIDDDEFSKRCFFMGCVMCLLACHGDPEITKALPDTWTEGSLIWSNPQLNSWYGDSANQRAVIDKMSGLTLAGWVAVHENPIVVEGLGEMAWKLATSSRGTLGLFFGLANNQNPTCQGILIDFWKQGFSEKIHQYPMENGVYKHEEVFELFPAYNDEGNVKFKNMIDAWLNVKHPEFTYARPEQAVEHIHQMLLRPPSWIKNSRPEEGIVALDYLARKFLKGKGPEKLSPENIELLEAADNPMGWITINSWDTEENPQACVDLALKIVKVVRNDRSNQHQYIRLMHDFWINGAKKHNLNIPKSLKNPAALFSREPNERKRVLLGISAWVNQVQVGNNTVGQNPPRLPKM